MDLARLLAAAPSTLRHSSERAGQSYTLAGDLVAVHRASADRATLTHEGEGISIERSDESSRDLDGAAVGPVYRSAHGGAIAVPTGRALVRFGGDDRAERHREAIAAAGFDLEQPLPYAPQAAWVRASSGRIVDTLSGLARLERLPGVENVEPQLITEAVRRSRS